MRLHNLIENINERGHNKAVILIGSPGSGKSYIVDKALKNGYFKVINPDIIYEKNMKKNSNTMDSNKASDEEFDKILNTHSKATALSNKVAYYAMNNGVPIIIDKTGRNKEDIITLRNSLKKLGYSIIVIYVKTTLNQAIERNNKRERKVDIPYLKQSFKDVKKNIEFYNNLFSKFYVIDNNSTDTINFRKIYNQINNWMMK